MRSIALCALTVVASACMPTSDVSQEDDFAAMEQDIVGGTTAPNDTNVFYLYMQGNNGGGGSCTATLIDRRTLLTAAHCVDPAISGATSLQIYAMNKPTEAQAYPSDYIRVIETRTHPGWNAQTLSDDIAMAYLEVAPTNVTPKPWNKASLDSMSGAAVRAVGYGLSAPPSTGGGVRRQVSLNITQVYPTLIRMGNGSTKGICQGDSGGPTFMTFSDGIERVVGVHSFTTSQTCTDGADTRVDAFQSFVQQWLNDREQPTCGEDGRCATGCAQIDLDCVCGGDGRCTTDCPNLLKDPDCPKDCVANGICALQACPTKDVDCLNLGQPCQNSSVCPGRLCVTDALHPSPYCSQPCSNNSGCTNGLECDTVQQRCVWPQIPPSKENEKCTPGMTYCEPPLVCTGSAATTSICRKTCTVPADCGGGTTCGAGFDGTRYCVPPPEIRIPRALTEGTAAKASCASVPGLPLVALAALALRRKKQRRN
jgi:hypothetical protein